MKRNVSTRSHQVCIKIKTEILRIFVCLSSVNKLKERVWCITPACVVMYYTSVCGVLHQHVWCITSACVVYYTSMCGVLHQHVWYIIPASVVYYTSMCSILYQHVWCKTPAYVVYYTSMCDDVLYQHVWCFTPECKGYYTNINVTKNIFLLDCCVECNAALVAEHFTEGEVFENANIYVRKITDQHNKEDIQVIPEVRNV